MPLAKAEEARAELLEFAAHGFEERDLPGELELAVYGGSEVEQALQEHFGAVSAEAVEPGWSEWDIVHSSADYTQLDSSTVEFRVHVPANGETTLNYTVRYTWP